MNADKNQSPESIAGGHTARCCPRCERPAEVLILGVCPACKATCAATHGNILKPEHDERPVNLTREVREPAHFDDEGARVQTTADVDGGLPMVLRFCELTGTNYIAGVEMLAVAAELLPKARGEAGEQNFRRFDDLLEQGFLTLRAYVKAHGNPVLAERCLWLLLDKPVLAGADSIGGLVKLLGIGKQTVNKCVQHFQEQMPDLPPLPNQRDREACDNMKQARIEQLGQRN